MARPLSKEKRLAILEAAAQHIALVGLAATTSKIAAQAQVSEGTLFTYFATKDDLLNQLFLEIETELVTLLLASPGQGGSREQVKQLWDCFIEWGLARPLHHKALQHLKASERITEETRLESNALLREVYSVVQQSFGHIEPDLAAFYLGPIIEGLVGATLKAIAANPDQQERLKAAGFNFFWKGMAAE